MDAATAQPMIDEVDDAIKQAESLAASTSDPTLQGQQENATAMLRKSWSDWSTRQLQQTESNPPTRTDENWTEYGGTTDESDANSGSLLAQAKRFIRDNGSIYAQWSAAINTAGNAAQAVESYVQSNIKDWRTALEGYKASLAAFQAKEQSAQDLEAALKPVADQLSPEAHELLYGQSAQDAVNKLALLPTLIRRRRRAADSRAAAPDADRLLHDDGRRRRPRRDRRSGHRQPREPVGGRWPGGRRADRPAGHHRDDRCVA